MIFQTCGARCKTGFSDLQNVAINFCIVQRSATKFCKEHALSWDCLFDSRKSKPFNLASKGIEYTNSAYFNLYCVSLTALLDFSDFTADRLNTPNYCIRVQKLHDEIN
jgi:hypothetical protein